VVNIQWSRVPTLPMSSIRVAMHNERAQDRQEPWAPPYLLYVLHCLWAMPLLSPLTPNSRLLLGWSWVLHPTSILGLIFTHPWLDLDSMPKPHILSLKCSSRELGCSACLICTDPGFDPQHSKNFSLEAASGPLPGAHSEPGSGMPKHLCCWWDGSPAIVIFIFFFLSF
jgi:hypothetical protein